MKNVRIGIVAEYNPFHNGHIYQINEIKKRWPNSTIVVVMSGRFVQRGEIAIAPFEKRKEIALQNGVDELYELPFFYATQAAHIFAYGAIMELHKHNIDILVFGSETDRQDTQECCRYSWKSVMEAFHQILLRSIRRGFAKCFCQIREK